MAPQLRQGTWSLLMWWQLWGHFCVLVRPKATTLAVALTVTVVVETLVPKNAKDRKEWIYFILLPLLCFLDSPAVRTPSSMQSEAGCHFLVFLLHCFENKPKASLSWTFVKGANLPETERIFPLVATWRSACCYTTCCKFIWVLCLTCDLSIWLCNLI